MGRLRCSSLTYVLADTAVDVAMTVTRLIPAAARDGKSRTNTRKGTSSIPPPIPNSEPSTLQDYRIVPSRNTASTGWDTVPAGAIVAAV